MACHRAMMNDTVENERSPPDIIDRSSVAALLLFAFLQEYSASKSKADTKLQAPVIVYSDH